MTIAVVYENGWIYRNTLAVVDAYLDISSLNVIENSG